jgi:FKBP-type peptidyl-prolyl cis-trans isomerase SlyD
MKIAENSVVTLEYALHLGDGVIVDRSEAGDPLVYLHGMGDIVPGLESALEGLEAGASKQVVVTPDDGYGPRDEQAVQTLASSAFGDATFKEGDEFVATDDDGNDVPVKVLKIAGSKVTVDFNHPLAGKTLHFSVQVREVRAATGEELEHGHIHGEHGHDHE